MFTELWGEHLKSARRVDRAAWRALCNPINREVPNVYDAQQDGTSLKLILYKATAGCPRGCRLQQHDVFGGPRGLVHLVGFYIGSVVVKSLYCCKQGSLGDALVCHVTSFVTEG